MVTMATTRLMMAAIRSDVWSVDEIVLMMEILHDPISTILPELLWFWYLKPCRIYIINRVAVKELKLSYP